MKWTIVFSILVVFAVFTILEKGSIVTGPEVFLPGYKPGVPFEEIPDPDVQALVESNEIFGDHLTVLVILSDVEGFFTKGKADEIERVEKALEGVVGVRSVLSVLDVPKGIFGKYVENGTLSTSVLENENAFAFIGKDGKKTIVMCFLDPDSEPVEVVRRMREVLSGFRDLSPMMFGEPVIDDQLFKELSRQNYVYPPLIFLAILLVFYAQTRSVLASFLSIVIPVMASLIVIAFHFLLGNALNTMTAMVTSYLMIIGSAYGLHFYNALVETGGAIEARKKKFRPIFFSMLTTVAGFSSFVFLKIRAFKEFGILVSSGLALITFMVFTLMGEILKRPKGDINRFGVRYPGDGFSKTVLVIMIVISALSPLALKNIEIGTSGVEYFREDSEVVKAHDVLKDYFGFTDSIYVILKSDAFTAKDNSVFREIASEIEKLEGVSSVVFPFDIPIPVARIMRTPFLRTFVSGNAVRLMVNLDERGVKRVYALRKEIEDTLNAYPYDHTLAGTILVWDRVNSEVLKSQIESMSFAFLLILAMMFYAFKSLGISLVGIVPIAFTTLMNFVNMGVLRINLEISTSIIASMLMGLTIDYSIHVISDSLLKDPERAVLDVGPAVVANALGLDTGFFVLLFSVLMLFFNVSVLTILGISLGAFLSLTVEPYLLKKILRSRSKLR